MSDVPVYSECVIGYRQWEVADWVLSPTSVGYPWRPGVNHARCIPLKNWAFNVPLPPGLHKAPDATCPCGLYAMHEIPEKMLRAGAAHVLGAVAAWGDMQVHHAGFRAEYAQIVALEQCDIGDAGDLGEIARLYGVPLVSRDMLRMEAERHGQPFPASIRPELPKPDENTFVYVAGYSFPAPPAFSLGYAAQPLTKYQPRKGR